jgi:predicted dehydrogenase
VTSTVSYRTISNVDRPVRVIQVGAGGMGQNWLQTLEQSDDVEIVGVVDLNLEAARTATAKYATDPGASGGEVGELIDRIHPDAIIDVTVPAAHHPVTTIALMRGVPVLGEKPAALTVAEALSLAALSEVSGELFMVSQSRRYDGNLTQFRAAIDQLGGVGFLTGEHFKAPQFGGFRDEMEHPFLLDMAIHAFDAARYLLDADAVAVYCEEFNPPWSWYTGAASTSVLFEMTDGQRFAYQGSWCSPGLETSWNGSWRASGALGTALWDGDSAPRAEFVDSEAVVSPMTMKEEGLAGSLAEFISALRGRSTPTTEITANIPSLAMVEAALESARTGARVAIPELMQRARQTAIADEINPEVRQALLNLAN